MLVDFGGVIFTQHLFGNYKRAAFFDFYFKLVRCCFCKYLHVYPATQTSIVSMHGEHELERKRWAERVRDERRRDEKKILGRAVSYNCRRRYVTRFTPLTFFFVESAPVSVREEIEIKTLEFFFFRLSQLFHKVISLKRNMGKSNLSWSRKITS